MWFWLAAVFLLPSGDSAPVDRASEVRCRDIALTRGPYRLRSRSPDGEAVEQWAAFNSIWRKDDAGEWRVVFDAGSPAAAPLPERPRNSSREPARRAARRLVRKRRQD